MINHISKLIAFNDTELGSVDCADASAPLSQPNEGGTATAQSSAKPKSSDILPPSITWGESICNEIVDELGEKYLIVPVGKKLKVIHLPQPKIDGIPSSAIIDYFNCSFPFSETEGFNDFFAEFLPIVGSAFSPVENRNQKFRLYHYSFNLGSSKAIFAYGGNNSTALLSLSGHACHLIPDWHRLVDFLENTRNARITRLDCAHDDYSGIHSVNNALRMYEEGLFNTGGREPSLDHRGNWFKPDGKGRTLYIGSGKNGKLLRVYEKGMQLGAKFHPWVRWEIQYGNRDRIIPWEAVLRPGNYLAGSYANATGWISEERTRIKILQKTAKISYEKMNESASIAYGKHFNVMMQVEGSAEKVLAKLIRDGVPSRLNLPELPNQM
ncbi:MAG: replication initiation factor domain-containing protein [Pseudomonadota bacterium]